MNEGTLKGKSDPSKCIIKEPVLQKKPHKDVGNSVQHAGILKKKKGLQVSA